VIDAAEFVIAQVAAEQENLHVAVMDALEIKPAGLCKG
jgi:hypothetical protein